MSEIVFKMGDVGHKFSRLPKLPPLWFAPLPNYVVAMHQRRDEQRARDTMLAKMLGECVAIPPGLSLAEAEALLGR